MVEQGQPRKKLVLEDKLNAQVEKKVFEGNVLVKKSVYVIKSVYVGHFEHGYKHGRGSQWVRDVDGQLTLQYEGEWIMGQPKPIELGVQSGGEVAEPVQ